MPKRSSVQALPPELLEEVETLWGSGRYTLDQMVERLREMGAEVSRSALGRQTQKWDQRLQRFRASREMVRAWKAAIKDDPDGDVGQILGEQLGIMAYELTDKLDELEGDQRVGVGDMVKLARMARDLASTGKLRVERELRRLQVIRQEAEVRTKRIEKDVESGKVTDPAEVLRRIREDVYGIFDQ